MYVYTQAFCSTSYGSCAILTSLGSAADKVIQPLLLDGFTHLGFLISQMQSHCVAHALHYYMYSRTQIRRALLQHHGYNKDNFGPRFSFSLVFITDNTTVTAITMQSQGPYDNSVLLKSGPQVYNRHVKCLCSWAKQKSWEIIGYMYL